MADGANSLPENAAPQALVTAVPSETSATTSPTTEHSGGTRKDARSRSLGRLWFEVKKAAIPAVVTGVLGYGGGLFIPPTAVYDRLLRQNPNDFGGTWLGSAAGSNAKLNLTETGGRNLSGTERTSRAHRTDGEA